MCLKRSDEGRMRSEWNKLVRLRGISPRIMRNEKLRVKRDWRRLSKSLKNRSERSIDERELNIRNSMKIWNGSVTGIDGIETSNNEVCETSHHKQVLRDSH